MFFTMESARSPCWTTPGATVVRPLAVSKVRDSRYVSGRGNEWVKKTCAQRETLTIAGFALDGTKWDGIYLARRKGKDLVYARKVDHGFDKGTFDGSAFPPATRQHGMRLALPRIGDRLIGLDNEGHASVLPQKWIRKPI